jgi:hypothetical protein
MSNTQRTQLMTYTMARTEWNAVLEDCFDSLDDAQLALQPCFEIAGVTLATQ